MKANAIPPAKPSVLRALLTVFRWRILLAGVLRLIRATLLFTAPLVLKAMIAFLKKPDAPTSRGYYLAAIIFVSGIVQSLSIRQYSYLSQEIGMCFRAAIQSAVYQKSLVIAPSAKRSSGQVTNLMSVDATRVQKLAVALHSIWGIPYLILLSYARTKLCNEVWGGIKVIKFQAWEKALLGSIQIKRATELNQLRVFLRLRSLASALSSSLPAFVAIASFSMYICLGNSLDVGTALTTMALFNILRLPLQNIPDIMNSIVEALLSLDRIRDYLLEEERLDITSGTLESPGVVLRDTTLQIPQTDEPFLANVNFKASSRSLVALVGPTGSGKLFKNGSIAYVAQHPFILNATVRENILFGLPFDQARYALALSCCCLNDALATLGAGDLTEIGDRGSTLSGGQRTLIALARAIYQDASIYLLDDVLASVDNHVGAHVFRECIKGALQDKLVILVTNASNVLGSCDRVVVLENKIIAADGPLAEVQDHPYLVNLRHNPQPTGDSMNTSIRPTADVSAQTAKAPSGRAISGKLIADEDRTRGVTSWRVYSVWLQACGGWPMVLLVISIYVVCEGMSVAASMWLSFWSEHGDSTTVWFYMGVFVVLQLTSVLFVYFRASEPYMAGIRGSESLFESILGHLLTAPMSFFDSTPLGRLANRFAADVYTADESLSTTWGALLATAITVLSTLATIIGVTPLFLVVILPIGYGYARTQLYYIKTSRELQRLVSISKSPVLSFFGETLDGLSTIRALPGISDVFTVRMHSILDRNLQAILLDFSVDCWLTLRLDIVGTLISTFAALCAVLQHGSTSAMFAGLAGVALSYAFTITKNMTQSVTNYSSLQTQMVAIERLDAYAHLPREDTQSLIRQCDDVGKGWPPAGTVEFDQVCLRYQPQLPLVLHNVTFSVPPRAKVGIVGRTGAGKSSLTAALFRLVELASGSISIDGVNIATLPLSTLRHAVSIIPQDPVLFSGSIRFNLDPSGEADDKALWQVVHRRGLNFSLGERQLVCIARALLKQSKVVVMDEATASIDLNADRLIQATVREVFADCTTITIAHRLDTILDADAVLVMDQGVVAEIGAPAQLLQDSDSLFYQLSERHAML
ncbi:unnamed protein product [Aphanomyces euteiches]